MLWSVLLPLVATWFLGSAAAFYLSWGLAGRAFDRALLDDAYAIAANVGEHDGALALTLSNRQVESVLFDREESEYFSVYDAGDTLFAGNADLRKTTVPAASGGFSDGSFDGRTVRIARLHRQGEQPFTVIVGQTTPPATGCWSTFCKALVPQIVLLFVLGIYLWRRIGNELEPLGQLQRQLDRRDSSDLGLIVLDPNSSDAERLRDAVNSLLGRIRQGVQAQREFAGNVAHELRTPLAGIRALAEYGLAHDEPAVWQQQLRSIVQSEDRASHLVDQLLALALADEAQDSIRPEIVRVDELVRSVLVSFVPRADAAGFEVSAEGLDGAVCAWASPVLLERILVNLIDNSLRYGRGDTASLAVTVRQEEAAVLVSVIDAGPGLEPAQREILARRWTRGSAGVELGAGSGLGLAIVSRYVALMQGELTLESGPTGRGLCAVVRLRAADCERADGDPSASANPD
jgi:Signal transduction histidine kinase